MEENRFLNRDFLIKVGIAAGIVLVLVLAIVLIVVLGGGDGADGIYGKNGENIAAYPQANGEVTDTVTKISLKGFVEIGGETHVLLHVNENKQSVVLGIGEKVMDVTLTSADLASETAVLSVSGTPVTLTLSSPSANIQR